MWPYWLLFVLTAWMALAYMKPQLANAARQRHQLAWPVFFVLLVLLIGLRHEVGGDWRVYQSYVENMQGEVIHEVWLRGDPAYELLNWIGANVGGGVYFVNFISACFFCWGLVAFCRTQPRPWLALLVATPYLITVVAMGYTRQGVAIGFAMLAITNLVKGSVIRFIFWIALATMFHKSAVVLVPFALFAGSSHRVLTVIGAVVSASLLFVLFLQEHLDGLIQNYFEAEYGSSGAAIRILMNAVPAALFLVFKNRFAFDPNIRSFWVWIAWGAILFVPLLAVSPSTTAIDRIALYWIPLQLVIWSRLPDAFGMRDRRNPLWVYLVMAYSATVMFVWLFFADHAHVWLPYQFYPWVALWA